MSSIKKTLIKRSAVTLIELIVVVIIVGIIATLGLPLFTKTIESTRGREAQVALEQIWAGQRVYRTEENAFYPNPGTENNIATINNFLRTELDARANRNWDFSVTSAAPNAFSARATRTAGRNTGERITINQNGTFGGNFTP